MIFLAAIGDSQRKFLVCENTMTYTHIIFVLLCPSVFRSYFKRHLKLIREDDLSPSTDYDVIR